MEPRLKSSRQWSNLPSDLLDMMMKLLAESFPGDLQKYNLIVEGRMYPEEVILRIGYNKPGDLRQENFEGSIDFKPGKEKVVDQVQTLFEATTSVLHSYFKAPDLELPQQWTKYDWEPKEVFLQHSRVNSGLESQADALLGIDESSLINQDSDLELEELKASLGLSEEFEQKKVEPESSTQNKTVH